MAAAFWCLLSFLLFSCMFNTSFDHIPFSCLNVRFRIFGWSYLQWLREIAKNVLIKNDSEILLKFYKNLVTFMKNYGERKLCLRNNLFEWYSFPPKFFLTSILFKFKLAGHIFLEFTLFPPKLHIYWQQNGS